jgi:hypothetical protein
MVFFMRISLHVNRPSTWRGVPARSNASSSATQSDELNKLNRRSSRSSGFLEDPARLDLFSKSRFTKHRKWARDDSVETQFLLVRRPSCGIIPRTYAADYYDIRTLRSLNRMHAKVPSERFEMVGALEESSARRHTFSTRAMLQRGAGHDTFDFWPRHSTFHVSAVSDAMTARALEDVSGKFATLQVDTSPFFVAI